MAEILQQRLMQLEASSDLQSLMQAGIGQCHALQGNRKGQYAMRLEGGYRLIFEYEDGCIKIVMLLEIVDYH